MKPCPNCRVAGKNFSCTNHITYLGDAINIPDYGQTGIMRHSYEDDMNRLHAEIGRLHLQLAELNKANYELNSVIRILQDKGIIDQWCRLLPLEGHDPECGQGKNGWSMCTCSDKNEPA